jgi:tetratricopeptide (TPR) repeat protein
MKMFKKQSNKAQSAVEYAVAFVVVVASLVSIGFIANAKGVFQNHFSEVADAVINADTGSMVVTAASGELSAYDHEDFNPAAETYTDFAEAARAGTSDGTADASLTSEEQAALSAEELAATQENLSQVQNAVTVTENRKNQAYADWQQAEGQYDYWCEAYEAAKKAYDKCHGHDCGYLYNAMTSAQSNKNQARQTADDLKDVYDQRVSEYETALDALTIAQEAANQAGL